VRLLLESGADTTVQNKHRQTALDLLSSSTEDEELRRLVNEQVALLEREEEDAARREGRGVGGVDLGDVVQEDTRGAYPSHQLFARSARFRLLSSRASLPASGLSNTNPLSTRTLLLSDGPGSGSDSD
jgi:hypothetical protein